MRIGIDIGSTTVKTVVLDDDGAVLYSTYERHYSKVRHEARKQLLGASAHVRGTRVRVAVTGSAGLGLAKAAGLAFVQEVYATAAAVRARVPGADAAVELGGEDAKIIFFGASLEERMNGSCAGGTGAFIDQMATLLGVTVSELDTLSAAHSKVYPIASRCGVFAKSDIQPILNQGGRREDIAASIFQAVVDQTVAGLTQGRELKGKIVFLGGPLTFISGLRTAFVKTLKLSQDEAVFPELAECFAAIGAGYCAQGFDEMSFEELLSGIEDALDTPELSGSLPALFESESEYAEFRARHEKAAPPDTAEYSGDTYLGIDAGSTTTKLVLISQSGAVLHKLYTSNMGNPVTIVLEELRKIYAHGDIKIRGACVTGYGEALVKSAFNIDFGLVETMAHFYAAKKFNPEVDFIIDIGGQDVKCFKIRGGAVDSILLNEACSSGCGSFIETFAKALRYPISEFSKLGLIGVRPVDLGSRCTVFMNSSVKQAQKDGATVESISAGLSVSIVKNAVYKVIRASGADDLGQNIVVQGGTFCNDAVLRGFEREVGRNVTRPAISELMGAYGAALYAMENAKDCSSILSSDQLRDFTHTSKPTTCNGCTNKCGLTINVFSHGRYISGNRCSKPLGTAQADTPNMFKYKYKRLRSMEGNGSGDGSRGVIGIPFGLNMYENLPFWYELLTCLNFTVKLSPESTRALYSRGQHTIPSDTVCYPAKIMHGHIEALLDQGVTTLFLPCMPYNFDEGVSDNNYNCPVVAYYPELLAANIPNLKNARFLIPYFGLHKKKGFIQKAAEFFGREFNVPDSEVKNAVLSAYCAYDDYKAEVLAEGAKCVEYARKNGLRVLVTAGRPYHIDPEINHGIDDMICSLGLVPITEDAVPIIKPKLKLRVLNQWTYQARMYNAARWVLKEPDAAFVQLVSFGCGTDAITTDELRDLLESGERLYTQIKIDEINNLGAVQIRLRSLIAALDARQKQEVASNGRT